jgi:hypothetical protein
MTGRAAGSDQTSIMLGLQEQVYSAPSINTREFCASDFTLFYAFGVCA